MSKHNCIGFSSCKNMSLVHGTKKKRKTLFWLSKLYHWVTQYRIRIVLYSFVCLPHFLEPWQSIYSFFFSVRLLSVLLIIQFFHPRHNGQWSQTLKDYFTRSYPLHYFLILFFEKEPVFPFSMFSAKQGNYWIHFYNVFGMTRSLTGDWIWDLPHSMLSLYH